MTASWVATGVGWALATLLVAGYTGLVGQDRRAGLLDISAVVA